MTDNLFSINREEYVRPWKINAILAKNITDTLGISGYDELVFRIFYFAREIGFRKITPNQSIMNTKESTKNLSVYEI